LILQTSATPPDLLDLRPNPGPELAPVLPAEAPLWPWLLGAAALLAALWVLLRRRRSPPLTPLQRFESALHLAEALLSARPQAALLGLNDAVRVYLTEALQYPAERRTADETIQRLSQDARISPALAADLAALLRDGEAAKFAAAEFSSQQVARRLAALRRWLVHLQAEARAESAPTSLAAP
jgi:hypothetical protein